MTNLNRDTLDVMLPEGPGKAQMLDIADAVTDPYSLANRILTVADHAERASRFKTLAQVWADPETAFEWARQNLSNTDKTAFYTLVVPRLADQNPQVALQILAELKVTDAYAFTIAMIRTTHRLAFIVEPQGPCRGCRLVTAVYFGPLSQIRITENHSVLG